MTKLNFHNQVITCLIGDPVEHSVSDIMFQQFARLTGIENYNHLKLRVLQNNPKNLEIAIRSMSVFGMVGANITLPYKESAIKYLDVVDKTVKSVGAVNTIVNRNRKGKFIGYNTDGHGAIRAIETKLRPIKKTDKILILGAGGAARAIIGSLPRIHRVTILSRASDSNRVKKLEKDFAGYGFEIKTEFLTDRNIISEIKEANFIINATPVGMYPRGNISLVNKAHLNNIGKSAIKKMMFFDAVFNPFETEFLHLAKQYGAKTCPGIYMMIYQGIKAFELWTGKKVLEDVVEKTAKLLRNAINFKYEK